MKRFKRILSFCCLLLLLSGLPGCSIPDLMQEVLQEVAETSEEVRKCLYFCRIDLQVARTEEEVEQVLTYWEREIEEIIGFSITREQFLWLLSQEI